MTNLIRALVCGVWLALASTAWGQTFTYHLVSEPGDWVGEGVTRTSTSANATLLFSPLAGHHADVPGEPMASCP